MRESDISQSQYLRYQDLENPPKSGQFPPTTLTIKGMSWADFKDGTRKRVISFVEAVKPLAANVTNWRAIKKFTGKDDDDQWVGERVELFVKHDIEYEGDTVSGIRIRKPSGAAPAPAASSNGQYAHTKGGAWAAYLARCGGDKEKAQEKIKSAIAVWETNSGMAQTMFTDKDWAGLIEQSTRPEISEEDIPF